MKKRSLIIGALGAMCMIVFGGRNAQAAFAPEVENAYNMAVQGQDALDGLNVSVSETTVSSGTNLSASKRVQLKLSGIKSNFLKASVEVLTDEGTSTSYYLDGHYYTETSDGKQKRAMERSDIWTMVNSEIYLDMTSNYLKMLYSKEDENGTTYYFAATEETLGDYAKKLLTGIGISEGITIDSLQGTMDTDADGHVLQRSLQIVYTVAQGENEETFFTQSLAQFHQGGEGVTIDLPDLSDYKEAQPEEPAVTITPLVRTVYVTADVNVRAAGDLSAVILGGLYAGSGVTQTGYTSDGWIQIQYNEAPGYVWGDYVSEKKPVLTKNSSGTMYATANVNVRAGYSSDSEILGGLIKGQAAEITGTTDNGWIRVKYNGNTGYVYADYLSWSEPVADTYVKNGSVSGTVLDASYGTLRIQKSGGGEMVFNTMYAELNLADTIFTGDWVEIVYSGSGTPYTASKISDSTRHEGIEEKAVSVEGVVASCSPSSLELAGSDGVYRTFLLTDTTDIEMFEPLCEGQVVTVVWWSTTNGVETRNIKAMRIRG